MCVAENREKYMSYEDSRSIGNTTHFRGLSMGWSVMMRYSKSSAADSTALIRSGVSSESVISAFSPMTVVQTGSFGESLVLVRERS